MNITNLPSKDFRSNLVMRHKLAFRKKKETPKRFSWNLRFSLQMFKYSPNLVFLIGVQLICIIWMIIIIACH